MFWSFPSSDAKRSLSEIWNKLCQYILEISKTGFTVIYWPFVVTCYRGTDCWLLVRHICIRTCVCVCVFLHAIYIYIQYKSGRTLVWITSIVLFPRSNRAKYFLLKKKQTLCIIHHSVTWYILRRRLFENDEWFCILYFTLGPWLGLSHVIQCHKFLLNYHFFLFDKSSLIGNTAINFDQIT